MTVPHNAQAPRLADLAPAGQPQNSGYPAAAMNPVTPPRGGVIREASQEITSGLIALPLNKLLAYLIQENGSDLHVQGGQVARIRVHGDLKPVNGLAPISDESIMQTIKDLLVTSERWEGFLESGNVDLSYALDERARFRVNAFRTLGRHGLIMRVIPTRIMTADEQSLPRHVRETSAFPRGLVLVTGPTGSGKSTLLSGIIDEANKRRHSHILTLEDPIEFTHKPIKASITQREIGIDTATFATGLRAALRQDPDIILVGEMRDYETAAAALQAAETGHLVFSTLHTESAAQAVDRIVDMFPSDQQNQIRVMLAETLKMIVTQTLVKRKDGHGRVAAREILVFTSAVKNLVRQGKTAMIASELQSGKSAGNQSMTKALADLCIENTISYEAGLALAPNQSEYMQQTGRTR